MLQPVIHVVGAQHQRMILARQIDGLAARDDFMPAVLFIPR
jgi:hypothetical protein